MAIEISLKKGTANPTSGLTLAEPLFNSTNNTLWMGKGSSNTPVWLGAGICGASGGIAAGLTYQIPTLGAVKDYFSAASSSFIGTTSPYISSFNGRTGAVQGVSSFNGQTGAVSFHNYVASFNGVTGAAQGVSSANGFTGAVTWLAGTGLEVSSGGGAITYGIGAGYALMRSVGNTGGLFAIENPAVGDLVFVQDRGTYYYWDYYSAGGTYDWINISLISNALQGDLNGDGTVNGADLGVLLGAWGTVYNGASLRMGVQDGLTGAFVIYADGSANPKKSDMVRVSTEGAVSEFRVDTDNLYLTGVTEINGENASYVALRVINGLSEFNGDTTVNGNLQIDNGGLLGGFVDGGTFA